MTNTPSNLTRDEVHDLVAKMIETRGRAAFIIDVSRSDERNKLDVATWALEMGCDVQTDRDKNTVTISIPRPSRRTPAYAVRRSDIRDLTTVLRFRTDITRGLESVHRVLGVLTHIADDTDDGVDVIRLTRADEGESK